MPAVSPTNLANWNSNEYYATDEEFRIALADALHEEYQAIVDAGLILQIDDPQLASHWAMHPEIDLDQCRRWASASVELLNHALRGIPADRVRYHTCYSINMGPRVHDLRVEAHRRHHAAAYRPAPIRSRRPTRGTSTSGGSGKTSSCRKARR